MATPETCAPLQLKAACSLSQANNYFLAACAKRLGLTPNAMNKKRAVNVLTLSFQVTHCVEIELPINASRSSFRASCRGTVVHVEWPNTYWDGS